MDRTQHSAETPRLIGTTVDYADGSEGELLRIISESHDRSTRSDELAAHIHDWPTRYHLSRLRSNLLRPLTIEEGSRVLEVGAGTGAITRYLGEQGGRVLAVEGSVERARIAVQRCRDIEGVEVVAGDIAALDTNDRFDLAVVVGVLEYASAPSHGPEAAATFLRRITDLLAPDGALAIAIENKLGLKYLLGLPEDHFGEPGIGVEGYPADAFAQTFSRSGLAALLNDAGLTTQKWLFPFPDYKLPTIILTDTLYEHDVAPAIIDQLVRSPVVSHIDGDYPSIDTRGAHRSFVEAGLGPDVANSFLVVAGRNRAAERFVRKDEFAWLLGDERRSIWLRERALTANESGMSLVLRSGVHWTERWLSHRAEERVPFIVGKSVEQLAIGACRSGDLTSLSETLARWLDGLRSQSVEKSEAGTHPFSPEGDEEALPSAYLDVNLDNFIIPEDGVSELVFVDREWEASGPVSLPLVAYRALWYFALRIIRTVRALRLWPRDTTVEDLAAQLAGAAGLEVPSGVRERYIAAESLLQALVAGGEVEQIADQIGDLSALTGRTMTSRIAGLEEDLEEAKVGWRGSAVLAESLLDKVDSLRGEVNTLRGEVEFRERTVEALEAQLVGGTASWLAAVSGPPLTAEAVEPDYARQYEAWLELPRPLPTISGSTREQPRFSILTPVFNPPAHFLEHCIRSVRSQIYDGWELLLVDVSSAPHVAPICQRYSEIDSRIRVVKSDNRGISANTNLAAAEATGDWLLLLDHDDELASHALAAIAEGIDGRPDVTYVYSDEDKIDEAGRRSDPFFKPDWSPDLLRTVNYITHLQAVRRDLWDEIAGLRTEYDGAQDYDLALRASWEAGGAVHIPDILYHWRIHGQSTSGDVAVKPHAHRAGRRALEDFSRRHLHTAVVEFGPGATSHRLRYPVRRERLSVIVPFRDNWQFTEACLEGIAKNGVSLPLDVLLVDNQSSEGQTLTKIEEWLDRFDWLRVLPYDEPFNFQKVNNWAAAHTNGELLLFLNNDIEPIHPGWVEAMAEHAQRPEVGAVGARLFYPNGLIQHAGVFVGLGGFADHPWAHLHPNAWTPAGPSYWTRNFLAVTAACLMIERKKFEQVGGFDERFVIGGGDVALGIALTEAGYWNVMTPYARLVHHESASRGRHVAESDLEVSRAVYRTYLDGRDPFFNRNLSLDSTGCDILTTDAVYTSGLG